MKAGTSGLPPVKWGIVLLVLVLVGVAAAGIRLLNNPGKEEPPQQVQESEVTPETSVEPTIPPVNDEKGSKLGVCSNCGKILIRKGTFRCLACKTVFGEEHSLLQLDSIEELDAVRAQVADPLYGPGMTEAPEQGNAPEKHVDTSLGAFFEQYGWDAVADRPSIDGSDFHTVAV